MTPRRVNGPGVLLQFFLFDKNSGSGYKYKRTNYKYRDCLSQPSLDAFVTSERILFVQHSEKHQTGKDKRHHQSQYQGVFRNQIVHGFIAVPFGQRRENIHFISLNKPAFSYLPGKNKIQNQMNAYPA